MDVLTRMATFVRVVEAGSLTAAAKQLRISAAAVSRQLTALEREVGAALLARTTRRVAVTGAGHDYYERCVRILRDVDEAQSLGRVAKLDRTLRISVPVTLGQLSGASLVRPLLAKHPELRLDVRVEDRLIDLVLEDVDVAVRVGAKPPPSNDVVARPLATERLVLVASPGYIKRRGVPRAPADLASHDALVGAREAVTGCWVLTDGEGPVRVPLKVRFSCNDGQLLRALARDGLGVALLPRFVVVDDLEGRRLRRLLPRWQAEPVVVYALYRAAHRNERRVRLLVEHLRRAYALAVEAEAGRPAEAGPPGDGEEYGVATPERTSTATSSSGRFRSP